VIVDAENSYSYSSSSEVTGWTLVKTNIPPPLNLKYPSLYYSIFSSKNLIVINRHESRGQKNIKSRFLGIGNRRPINDRNTPSSWCI